MQARVRMVDQLLSIPIRHHDPRDVVLVGEVGLGHTPLGMHQGILELRIFDFLIRDRGDDPTLQKYEGLE